MLKSTQCWTNKEMKISKVKLELLGRQLISYIPFTLYCLLIGYFSNRLLEAVVLLCIFAFIRTAFYKTFHFINNDGLCFGFSCIMFNIAIPNTIPFSISLFGCVITSFVIGYVSFKIQDYLDLKYVRERTLFDLPKEELISFMENSTLSDEEKDAIQYKVIDKLKGEHFYRAMGYSKRQSLRIYKSAVIKINNLIRQ